MWKFRTPDFDSDSGSKKTRTPTVGLIVWHNDCVLTDDMSEISNSSNTRCTIVYKHSFSCSFLKLIAQKSNRLQQNYTEVQMKQIGPGVRVSFKWETPTPTPIPGQNPDSDGLLRQLHTYAQNAAHGLRSSVSWDANKEWTDWLIE